MRSQTLLVTRACGQRCGFCDRVDPGADPRSEASFEPVSRLFERIESAAAEGAKVLTVTGGEATLHPRLGDVVRRATERGLEVHLESNGALKPAQVEALAEAGVDLLRLSFLGASPETHLGVSGTEGSGPGVSSPRRIIAVGRAWLERGGRLEIRLPIARGCAPAAARVRALAELLPGVDRFTLAPIGAGERTLRSSDLPPEEQAREVAEAWDAGRRAHVEIALDPDHAPPPCIVPYQGASRRAFAPWVARRDQDQVCAATAECSRCALAARCRASSRQVEGGLGPDVRPRPLDDATSFMRPGKSAGSRLHVLGAREVESFFHVDYEYDQAPEHLLPTSRIGIIYRCNQVCTFCELADMNTEIAPETIIAALDSARARGSTRVILTGGEPTLCPSLPRYIAHARDIGFEVIEIQTNAVRLADPDRVAALVEAGLTNAQISLHGPDPTISDRLTAGPGTHDKTLKGVGHLLEAGVVCLLNHLIFKDNCGLLEDFVELVERRWGRWREQIVVQFHSPRNEFPTRSEALAHVPRYAEYVDGLRRALDRSRELGFSTQDLQDPTGIPALCVLGADPRYLGPILDQAQQPRVHEWEREWMVHPPACGDCRLKAACLGVPRHYLALHGADELVPFDRHPR